METKTMTRIQKVATIALAVALIEGGAVALYAQGPGGRGRGAAPLGGPGGAGGPGRGFAAGFRLGQLDLSDAQKQQIRDITKRYREQSQPIVQRLQQAMEAQRSAITAIPVDESLVRSAARGLAEVQADLAVAQAQLHADIFALLTVEQQDKAKQLEASAKARMQERRQRAQKQPRGQV
jgi:Spy/CpxP family protein refolding chaperone